MARCAIRPAWVVEELRWGPPQGSGMERRGQPTGGGSVLSLEAGTKAVRGVGSARLLASPPRVETYLTTRGR